MRFVPILVAALSAVLKTASAQAYSNADSWYVRLTYADGSFTEDWSLWPRTHECHELPESKWVETGEFQGNVFIDGYVGYTDKHCRDIAYAYPMMMNEENWSHGDWSNKVESEIHHVGRVVGSWSLLSHFHVKTGVPASFFNEDGPKKGKSAHRVNKDCPNGYCY